MIQHGMNLLRAKQLARKLGCEIAVVNRTGDIRFRHRLMVKPVLVNNRRRDASRALIVWLRAIAASS